MIPVLYYPTQPIAWNNMPTSHGVGMLSETTSCTVTEDSEGGYELDLEYPKEGYLSDFLAGDYLIAADYGKEGRQFFRIYRVDGSSAGNLRVYAQHVSYQLDYIFFNPFKPTTVFDPSLIIALMEENKVRPHPFRIFPEYSVSKAQIWQWNIDHPASYREGISKMQEIFGLQVRWDNFDVYLTNQRGRDNGVQIRYGRNLLDCRRTQDISKVITGGYAYVVKDGICTKGPVVTLENNPWAFDRIVAVDFSDQFDEIPDMGVMKDCSNTILRTRTSVMPETSISLDILMLKSDPLYQGVPLEEIGLHDTIGIIDPTQRINEKAVVNRIVYDVLQDRLLQADVGVKKRNIADTISELTRGAKG